MSANHKVFGAPSGVFIVLLNYFSEKLRKFYLCSGTLVKRFEEKKIKENKEPPQHVNVLHQKSKELAMYKIIGR